MYLSISDIILSGQFCGTALKLKILLFHSRSLSPAAKVSDFTIDHFISIFAYTFLQIAFDLNYTQWI